MKKVFLIVLDSFGVGALPDAANYGDSGANTIKSISKHPLFHAPTLKSLGLFNIDGVEGEGVEIPKAVYARMTEQSNGKDTIIGHWELCGIVSERDLPTYKDGFPKDVIQQFERLTGRKVICNKPYSGTEVIKDYGKQHVETGDLIVYTSADSVFQVAAHEDVVPLETLYEYCAAARAMLTGEHGVGRVIARPFVGEDGSYTRTANRHDYALQPPAKTVLNTITENGKQVVAIGKINDIFAGEGISNYEKTKSNADGMEKTAAMLDVDFEGLCFTNLVDFDMQYGHRRDIAGYAKAISEFDLWLSDFICKLGDEDTVIITADHGCDPDYTAHTDHTREYVPLIIYSKGIKPENLGTLPSFTYVGKTVCRLLGI